MLIGAWGRSDVVPKLGLQVFAVRAGPPLSANIREALSGEGREETMEVYGNFDIIFT